LKNENVNLKRKKQGEEERYPFERRKAFLAKCSTQTRKIICFHLVRESRFFFSEKKKVNAPGTINTLVKRTCNSIPYYHLGNTGQKRSLQQGRKIIKIIFNRGQNNGHGILKVRFFGAFG